MATKITKDKQLESIVVLEIQRGTINFCVLGQTPLIFNSMSSKVLGTLLIPAPRKSKSEKESTLKHNPHAEFLRSINSASGDDVLTRLLLPATAFKGALTSVCSDMPSVSRAQVGRLTYVNGEFIDIYGVPQIFLAPVRSADMSRTPDVRTRAIVPRWACRIAVTFTKPIIREKDVVNLLAAAGHMRGVGDFRPEKGHGTYGMFSLVGEDDPAFREIVATGGREVQDAALRDPQPYDALSAELLMFFQSEVKRRGFTLPAPNGGQA